MYESDEIVRYLATTYADGAVPLALRLGPVTTLSSSLASAARAGHGGKARPSRLPAEALELYNIESSPYCRLAREALCELELPYVVRSVGHRSSHRPDFVARSGKQLVPYLVDPNTGSAMFESADIVAYLRRTYGA